jgi:hypothetical protein
MTTMTIITGDDIYVLMTSPAMEPALVRDLATGAVEARSALYAADFPERYALIISRDDALLIDQSGDYSGEGAPTDKWCAMVADCLND